MVAETIMMDGESLRSALYTAVTDLVQRYDTLAHLHNHSSMFYASRVPAVGLRDYLHRIFKYSQCTSGCYVAALVYLQRIAKRDPSLRLNSLNVHRLIITAVVLAVKFHEDSYFSNSFYARVGGVSLEEFNQLEVAFLQFMDFRLYISTEEYTKCLNTLQHYHLMRKDAAIRQRMRDVEIEKVATIRTPTSTAIVNLSQSTPRSEICYQ
eukprot:Plantae.Rhodophyta-Purpureofilum_apyrenoidigerum.ctg634.p1 GENE.Plantae.Rhodophyta-Purpureofilum_apyrenoidigerum.ctg634~~Plantae.Rhodophyta-Purpureofilum_apyrenoidigerum.ctg634.p1  ORF type:complete len:209 (+),score=18.49 Plantae.Rhodophyta-Purpureofilum_apyrenoidigerum.ctg634:168-794(+)